MITNVCYCENLGTKKLDTLNRVNYNKLVIQAYKFVIAIYSRGM